MRCFVLVAALMGLTACGGEMLPEETQSPESTQVAAPGQVSEESLCAGNTWECFCASLKTQANCATVTSCIWWNNRCQPTYE